ncbi:hypothetical protein HYH03_005155 [Edaphochlamys debaryana]|uniref:Protein kinase domain-containing protein n=1 Tax=Edaphochlamys debaryana TaxID=47281 RepID=A0A835Y9L7_9CHLO|nr:hypothetical protein HYH03_005155 [Edaphochlamys debaryana]|eukprot:KAG2496746.1 hypothetical protein HYH03_005155 [Edaphochlamys debaryana]
MLDDPLAGHPTLRTLRVLGKNESHIVVLASEPNGQLHAVKLVPRGFDSRAAKYLLRELLNHHELTLCKHPHIVSLQDVFLTPRHLAIVLEYVDGENLQVFMEKAGGCVIEQLARFLFQQLVIALDFCHRRGKVNRAIRPSGLLLQLSASALPLLKLSDFSVSKDTLRNSEPKSQVGTAMFCAPEVLGNFRGAAYDAAAADVWSAGVVLFMMLFGRHPYSRPEDAQLPAQQQVIAMFKRVAAPLGSIEGELLVPHALPTSVLPGAKHGAPLSLAAADLLRGLLCRDPRSRITLDAVQRHEWFLTGLPEGAALLNDVVMAELAEAGAAAMLSPAVATALERMVVAAAVGPATDAAVAAAAAARPPAAAVQQQPPPGVPAVLQPVTGSGDSSGLVDLPAAATGSPDPFGCGVLQHQPIPTQPPAAVRTVTTTGSSPAVASVSIGSTVPAALSSSGPSGDAGASLVSPVGGAAVSPVLPDWSPLGTGGTVNGAAASGGDDGPDLMFDDLEALVMGLPDDDMLNSASLDFLMGATAMQQQQQQPQPNHQPPTTPPATRPGAPYDAHAAAAATAHSGAGSAAGANGPLSTDTTGTQPSPPQPGAHCAAPHVDRASDGGTGPPGACSPSPGHPLPAPAAPQPPQQYRPPPALFTSMLSTAGNMAGDVAAGLLARLRTESLPSPGTLAVVDAQPFLYKGSGNSGSGQTGGSGGWRDASIVTVPSNYSMDWCTLSARSEQLLGGAGTGAGTGGGGIVRPLPGGSGGGAGGGGGAAAPVPPVPSRAAAAPPGPGAALPVQAPAAGVGPGKAQAPGQGQGQALLDASVWHRICHGAGGVVTEAKGLVAKAGAGLTKAASSARA